MWLQRPRIRSNAPLSPTCNSVNAAKQLQQFHAELLDVVRAFLEPRQPHVPKKHHRASTLLKICHEDPPIFRPSCLPISDSSLAPLTTDAWAFGAFWPFIQEVCQTSDNLYENIVLRRAEIHEIREQMRACIVPIPGFMETFDTGTLSLIPNGISGSYFLMDGDGSPQFVLKPLDEDIGTINNPKGYASPFIDSPLRRGIPLYRSCFREVAAFQMAEFLGLSSVVPRTSFAIVQSDQFFDLSQNVSPREMQRYLDTISTAGPADKEKLCSVQEFVQKSKMLCEAMEDLQAASLLDEEIANLFDQKDFEDANLLLWITGDTDGHSGNFLVTPKRVDEIGNQIFGLKKIDNGLAFPEINGHLINTLSHLPNAKRPLSYAALAKIKKLDPDAMESILKQHGLDGAAPAMRARIEALQQITKTHPEMSIKAINKRLKKIEEPILHFLTNEICDDFEQIFAICDEGHLASIWPRSKGQKDAKSAQRSLLRKEG